MQLASALFQAKAGKKRQEEQGISEDVAWGMVRAKFSPDYWVLEESNFGFLGKGGFGVVNL